MPDIVIWKKSVRMNIHSCTIDPVVEIQSVRELFNLICVAGTREKSFNLLQCNDIGVLHCFGNSIQIYLPIKTSSILNVVRRNFQNNFFQIFQIN